MLACLYFLMRTLERSCRMAAPSCEPDLPELVNAARSLQRPLMGSRDAEKRGWANGRSGPVAAVVKEGGKRTFATICIEVS
jgi:hypothetical protein